MMKTIMILIIALAAHTASGADPEIYESDIPDDLPSTSEIHENYAEEVINDNLEGTDENNIILDNSRLSNYEERIEEDDPRDQLNYLNENDIILIDSRLKILEDSVLEVRRDQLNYMIEKDLLKNTYSSNLETLNTIITIVLGVFAVVAFLGVLSISSLRNQLKFELETFQNQREALERRLAKVENKQ